MRLPTLLAKLENLFDVIVFRVIGMILDGVCRIGKRSFPHISVKGGLTDENIRANDDLFGAGLFGERNADNDIAQE